MKKVLYLAFALAASASMAVSCGGDVTPEPMGPAVVHANYSSLVKGQESGEGVFTIPVSASENGNTLTLNFFNNIAFLSPGTYSVGEGLGKYNGHFKSDKTEGDITNGYITVALDGVKDYSISGTVRINDKEGTPVMIRAKGVLEYDIPTNFYYTETASADANGLEAHLYKVYEKETSFQIAEIAVVGDELGSYTISNSGEAGTAVYGSHNEGCWFYDASYGTYIMLHGSVTVSQNFPGRLNFTFTDTFNFTENPSVDFLYCEAKSDLVPAPRVGDGDVSFMMMHFYSVASPVVEGKYELTVKLNYTGGGEFLSFTGITDTPNPILEALINEGDVTGGVAFMPVSYEEYLEGAGNKSAIANTCMYVCDGVKYRVPTEEGFAMVMSCQKVQGIVAGLLAPTNMSYSLPGPLNDYLTSKGSSIWGLMGYYF